MGEKKTIGLDGRRYPATASTPEGREARARWVKQQREAGWSLRRIAKELNVSPSTVLADLRRDP